MKYTERVVIGLTPGGEYIIPMTPTPVVGLKPDWDEEGENSSIIRPGGRSRKLVPQEANYMQEIPGTSQFGDSVAQLAYEKGIRDGRILEREKPPTKTQAQWVKSYVSESLHSWALRGYPNLTEELEAAMLFAVANAPRENV